MYRFSIRAAFNFDVLYKVRCYPVNFRLFAFLFSFVDRANELFLLGLLGFRISD